MKKILLATLILAGTLRASAQCDPPTNLASSYSNNVSTFTWDAVPGAVGYTFQLKFQWSTWDEALEQPLTTNSFSLTGLFQSAPLEWRVATDCGTSLSAFSATQSYATPCPEPSGLTATNITGTSATLNWIPAVGYNTTTSDFVVWYRVAGSNGAWISLGHTSTPTKNVTGLLSNTSYEWKVSQSCMYSLGNSVSSQFTTLFVPCNIPTNLSVSNVSGTQATVSWTGVNGGLTYTIQYKPVANTNWSSASSTTSTSFVLSGLAQSTLYDVRVKANCTLGASGFISKQFTTYTSVCPSWGVTTSEWIDFVNLGTISRTSGAEIGGYYKSSLSTNLQRGSANNTITVSAGYQPGITLAENYAVYIDFNRNGTFGDVSNERVVSPTLITNGGNFTSTFSIPNNIQNGAAKMRVIIRRSNTAIQPCATGFSGETEDYDVNIVSGSLRSAQPVSEEQMVETLASLTVSPNPSKGMFTVQTQLTTGSSYEVINASGAIVAKGQIANAKSFIVDLSHQSSGIYLLNLRNSDGKMTVLKLVRE